MSPAATPSDPDGRDLPPPRDRAQRLRDAQGLLRSERTAWVATTSTDGPYMVPLVFWWDGAATLTLATGDASPTVTNLRRLPRARIAVGSPLDVVMIDAATDLIPSAKIAEPAGDGYASRLRAGPDPRVVGGHVYIQAGLERVQAWRHIGEIPGRILMRHGAWLPVE